MKKLVCCELSKNCFKRIEKVYQRGSKDFGIKINREFQIYLTQITLIKKAACVNCQDFQIWYEEYCEKVRKKFNEKTKNNISKKVSLVKERIQIIEKCVKENRDITIKEINKLGYVKIFCFACKNFIIIIGKENKNHVSYTCQKCGYKFQNKE